MTKASPRLADSPCRASQVPNLGTLLYRSVEYYGDSEMERRSGGRLCAARRAIARLWTGESSAPLCAACPFPPCATPVPYRRADGPVLWPVASRRSCRPLSPRSSGLLADPPPPVLHRPLLPVHT